LSAVHPLFDLAAPATSPFPSDRFTVADTSQNTGRRVNLPLPDPTTHLSDYQDTQLLNSLDGFNLQPRLSIPFDGSIDVNSVSSSDVFLVSLGDTLNPRDHGGQVVGINQVVWDPATNALHVESNDLLDQHTRYALIVTNAVHDGSGHAVEATLGFRLAPLTLALSHDPVLRNYGQEMVQGLVAAYRAGVHVEDIVTASVFTTESATAVLEKIRDQIHAETPDANNGYLTADFNLPTSPGGPSTPTVFSLNTNDPNGHMSGITLAQQTGWVRNANGIDQLNPEHAQYNVNGVIYTGYGSAPGSTLVAEPAAAWNLDLSLLNGPNGAPSAVGEVAFGSYQSPDYEVHPTPAQRAIGAPGEYIPPVGTRTGNPVVQGTNTITFDLFLPNPNGPAGPEPADGWPVAIFGHGNNDIKEDSFRIAETLAEHGIATIAINAVGHGFGPDSYLTVNQIDQNGAPLSPVTFLSGGRGIDQDNDGIIGNNEGVDAAGSESVLFRSDGIRQTAADLMQLVRVIQGPNDLGMNVPSPDGGSPSSHLDPNHVYYVGQSLGANYGTVFLAVEPDAHAGVISAPGNPLANVEWGPGRPNLATLLQSRTSLANSPGITKLGDTPNSELAVNSGPSFDENMPLRDGMPLYVTLADGSTRIIQSPVTNTVPGAMAIQEALDNLTWTSQVGNVVAYAPHLRKAPLAGVSAKSVIILMNKGDESAPNPNATAMIRAGDLADRVAFYRHDVAHAADPTIPVNPHQFLLGLPVTTSPLEAVVEMAKQRQVANFFASDGQFIDDLADVTTPDGTLLFEVPIAGPLPEDLNYIIPTPAPAPAPQSSGSRASGPIPMDPAGGSPPVSDLFMALQLGGMPAGPGADTAASSRLSLQLLALNSLNPDSWRVNEPTQADEVSHGASWAPALADVFDHVFTDRDDSWLQDMFGDYQTAARVG
jgi:dienelactone hydrolase